LPEQTKDWQLYESGKKYNNNIKPNYYDTVNANIAFFNGDQWRNLEAEDMPKPVFNIIKRVITFQVASLTSSKTRLHFEPLLNVDNGDNKELTPSDFANAQVQNLFEKFKMDFKIKDTLFDAATTGDGCAHFYFDISKKPFGNQYANIEGEIELEIVDGANVFFGNANNFRVESQPYIIISGRDMVQNLKEEAKRFKQAEQEINNIDSDKNYGDMAGDSGKIEVDADEYGKALYIIVYRKDKKTGTIKASKSVENAYIYKDVDTGLENYPVAWMNWEKQKNQYHGRALCTGILPNQIFINRMFAMVMYHLMMTAFPKAVYNADVIENWSNEIGESIGVVGLGPEQNIKNIAGYLEPGNMSNQIMNTIEQAMQYTKETLGISDAALGQVDPKNTSAIIAVQKSSAIPLENPKANLYEWIEDIGRILFDMMGTYYGERPIVIEQEGVKQVMNFDFSTFKNMWLNVRADVGESSYWSEIAAIQTLDNLLGQNRIEFLDYLERVPDEYIPQKQELISKLKQAIQMQQQQAEQQAMMQQQQGQQQETIAQQQSQDNQPHVFDQLLAKLPKHEQENFRKMDPKQQQTIMDQMMQPAPQ
jgi:hypothetical protein